MTFFAFSYPLTTVGPTQVVGFSNKQKHRVVSPTTMPSTHTSASLPPSLPTSLPHPFHSCLYSLLPSPISNTTTNHLYCADAYHLPLTAFQHLTLRKVTAASLSCTNTCTKLTQFHPLTITPPNVVVAPPFASHFCNHRLPLLLTTVDIDTDINQSNAMHQ